jgi:hypothetical protein
MLDVHPPHHAANSWRDFFVHIATIVVGLLIAIGLEQCVEMVHERHQARETSEALQREFEANHGRVVLELKLWRRGVAALQNNLIVLRALHEHPGTPEEKLPGTLYWAISNMVYDHAEWDAAQQSGIVKLLPQEEAPKHAFQYLELQRVQDASNTVWLTINDAEQFTLADPDPSHLSPTRLEQVIGLTEKALTQQILVGEALLNLDASIPDIPNNVSRGELDRIRNRRTQESTPALAAADAMTRARLDAAGPKVNSAVPRDPLR